MHFLNEIVRCHNKGRPTDAKSPAVGVGWVSKMSLPDQVLASQKENSALFLTSVKPVIWLLRIVGVELDPTLSQSIWKRLVTGFVAAVFLIYDVGIRFAGVSRRTLNVTSYEPYSTSVFSLSRHLMNWYFLLHTVGIHLCLLLVSITQWHHFLEGVNAFACRCRPQPSFYDQLRHLAVIGFLYIIFVVTKSQFSTKFG